MRWDYGHVYKKIRKSKGLTQSQVCGDVISRSTLAKIENGTVIPSFENMVFLLEQIDMTLSEFKYICNEFNPSQRRKIITKAQNLTSATEVETLLPLIKDCEKYLKTNHDVPIQNIYFSLQILVEIRTKGFIGNKKLEHLTQVIWSYLEPMDTWYFNDLRLLSTILYHFNSDILFSITLKIFHSLEKYENFRDIKPYQLRLLTNLSTIYFRNRLFNDCAEIVQKVITLAKELKTYDILGFSQVRLGMCQKDDELIEKGMALLKLTEENHLVATLEKELEEFYQS